MLFFRLWLIYFFLTVKNSPHIRKIRNVQDTEMLGRALFDGFKHVKKSGKITSAAFRQKSGVREISVNRISLAPIKLFIQLSQREAIRRTYKVGRDVKFCGFAKIETSKLRKTILQENKKFTVSGTPKFRNPFHADIAIQPDEGKDFEYYVIESLCRISEFQKYPPE